MAIYKLGELILGKPIYGSNQRGLASGKYKYLTQSDIILKSPRVFVNNTDGKVLKKDDFIISRAGTILPYLHEINEEWVYAGYLIKYRLNKNLCIPKYVYYWFKGPGNKTLNQYSNTGSTMPKMNPNTSLNIKINLPNLKEQQKIIDIIEPVEEVFFRYKQCIRLDTYENTKNDIRKIIDIIEPVEEVKNLLNKYHLKLLEFIAKLPLSGKNIKIKELLKSIKNEKKNISQISAKVINKNTGQILNLERENTYQTNSYFCEARTFLFCSIRTYLKKWAITPFDADVNGTLYQFKILQNITQLIKYFMSEKSWNKFSQMSKGTKMPVIDKDVFLDILIPKTMVNIDKIDILLVTVNKLLIKLNNLLKKMVLFFIV